MQNSYISFNIQHVLKQTEQVRRSGTAHTFRILQLSTYRRQLAQPPFPLVYYLCLFLITEDLNYG